MARNSLFALLVLVGTVAWSEAQYYPPRRPARLDGTWFYEGTRFQPCAIQMLPRGGLLLTNEKGEQARGHIAWGGRVVADDWGSLVGEVRGNVINWSNGTYWTR
jgi:hypothetical protein